LKMSTSSLAEMIISTPLGKKPSDTLLEEDGSCSPSLSLISPPALVKFSTVTPCHYNLRGHHLPGYTPRWSSTPLPVSGTAGAPLPPVSSVTRTFSSPAVIGSNSVQVKEILDFQKRLEVLDDKEESEVDSGFESLIQSIDESDVSTSRREDKKLVGESDDLTEESTPSWTAAADSSLGAVPKRRSPRFKQKPVTDRLGKLRSGSRSAKRLEVSSKSYLTTVARPDRAGKEVFDIVRFLWQMNLSSDVLFTLFSYLSSPELCSAAQVSSTWREAVQSIPSHNERRLAFISKMKIERENFGVELSLQPKRVSPRRVMQEVANTRNRSSPTAAKRDRNHSASTVISPSKVRHKLFVDEAQKLTAGERLVQCPVCTSPSRVSLSQPSPPRAECSSPQCQFLFCPDCKCELHQGKSCRQARPGSRLPKSGGITSKKSKARLRRL